MGHRPASKLQVAKRYLIANPTAGNEQVARACQVSLRLVGMARAELRSQGILQQAHGDWTSSPPTSPSAPETLPMNTTEFLAEGERRVAQRIAEEAALSGDLPIEVQLRTCAKMANNPKESPQVRLAAMVQYNRIKREKAALESFGPGTPLTEEDRVHRLSLLCEAVGFTTAVAAFERAFGQKGNDGEADAPLAAPEVPEAPAPVGHDPGGDLSPEGAGEGDLGQEDGDPD